MPLFLCQKITAMIICNYASDILRQANKRKMINYAFVNPQIAYKVPNYACAKTGKVNEDYYGYKKWGISGGCKYEWPDKKILIIDNDELNCQMLSIFLKSTRVIIDYIFDPLKIRKYNHIVGSYDLIIMEIYLCGSDGMELLENIIKTDPKVPVIVHSVLSMPYNKESCYNAGCAAYFTKPAPIWKMMEVMDGLI